MTTAAPVSKALLAAPKTPKPPAAEIMVRIAREHGVSPLRQLREIIALRVGPGKLAPHEYVSTGTFRPEFDITAKREFVGAIGSKKLNQACSPARLTPSNGFVRDKALFGELLHAVGVPATETQAIVHCARRFGHLPALRDAQAVRTFLLHDARFPIFGKPVEGSRSVGSVLIEAVDRASGLLRLGNGRQLDLDSFAHEAIADYPEGFMLQTAIHQHEAMRAVTGDAVGSLRVVTLRDADGIAPLYTLWKVPSPTAMSDNYWQDGSMIAEIDPTGRVMHCVRGSGPDYGRVDRHPVSGVTFTDLQIPHWERLHQAAVAAHGIFPEFGIIGWDISMDGDGPVIIEANTNPFHTLYQLAACRGVLNPEFKRRFDSVIAESRRMLQLRQDTDKERANARKS